MKKKIKTKISHKLAKDLTEFLPAVVGKFMCPVCLDYFEQDDQVNITDGHIIPNAAGGKESTLLCKKCNGNFGKGQDKWFGEYLNVLLDENQTLLSAKTKCKYIEINGVKVRGDVRELEDGSISVFLPVDHNPPGVVDSIEFGSSMTMSFESPLVRNQWQIEIGYLTAAYLMWFKQLGYSWVFQDHLDGIRRQILNPEDKILDKPFMVDFKGGGMVAPCIGVVDLGERSFPCSVVFNKVIVFPTRSDPDIYDNFIGRIRATSHPKFYSLSISRSHKHPSAMGLIYKNSALVVPEQFPIGKLSGMQFLFFPDASSEPVWLRHISEGEYKDIVSDSTVNTIETTVK